MNGGSLEKELLAKYGRVTPEALVESALRHVRLLEKFDFTEICISVRALMYRSTWRPIAFCTKRSTIRSTSA